VHLRQPRSDAFSFVQTQRSLTDHQGLSGSAGGCENPGQTLRRLRLQLQELRSFRETYGLPRVSRFGLLPEGTDAVEVDQLLGYFARLPRLPKLAGPQVLRAALVEGVAKGLFGLASGSAWDADDAVLWFAQRVDPGEVQFQPGTFLVRASAIKELLAQRKAGEGEPTDSGSGSVAQVDLGVVPEGEEAAATTEKKPSGPPAYVSSVTLTVKGIPGSKARDVVKVAVLPLAAHSSGVTMDVIIRAEGGLTGIPRETLELVVLEGLRQLGMTDVQLELPG